MKTFNLFYAIFALLITLAVPGCIGDEGPMGIQGEQGIPGLDGSIFYAGNTAPTSSIGKDGDMYLDKATAILYGPKSSGSWGTGVSLTGPEGAKGDTGAQGQAGATGAQGPAGAQGSQILSGNGSPALTTGVVGDYYLDKTTGLLYGPKTSIGWGTPTNLKGEQGIQGLPGKDGSMFYSGNGAPANNIGKDGDMYLDKINVLLYGPKTPNGWGTGLSLKGATGETGSQGPAGAPGSKILAGNGSPVSTTGVVGDYYLDKTTGLLYGPKTSIGWGTPTNLKGEQGIQGLPGKDGSMFYSGNETPANNIGKDGDMYLDKTNVLLYGPKTPNGWGTGLSLKGATGETGSQGLAGTPGSKILSGSGAPVLTLGVVGDYYIDISTALFYGPKSATSWGTPISLKGPKGDKGDPGTTNVIYSEWLPAKRVNDFIFQLSAPELISNPELIDNASIVLYAIEYNTDGTTPFGIFQLNFTSPVWGSIIQYRIDIKDRVIIIQPQPDTKLGLDVTHLFRYVIIPGGIPSTRSSIDFSDYYAIKETFGLKD